MVVSGLLSSTITTNQTMMQDKNIYLLALEAEQQGDWAKAHGMVENMVTAEAARVHAYLHRVQGDECDAQYWYNRAVQPICITSLDAEWKVLYAEFEGLDRD
jgi:hypothetical protein